MTDHLPDAARHGGEARPLASPSAETDTPRVIRGQISLARVAKALDVDLRSEQMRVGLHRLAKELRELSRGRDTLGLAAEELDRLKPRVLLQEELDVAHAETVVQVKGCSPAVAALLELPPPLLGPAEKFVWRERRVRLYLRAIVRDRTVSAAVAEGLVRLGKRSATAIRTASVLAGPAPEIAALAHRGGWLRPVARAFHTAAVQRLSLRVRPVASTTPSDRASRERKYRPLARLKPLIVRAMRLRATGPLSSGRFTISEPQWRTVAARLPGDLKNDVQASFACASYITCRFQVPPRNFDSIKLGEWRTGKESWLDLSAEGGHLSLSIAGLTGTTSRWPAEFAHRAVLFIPVAAPVLDYLRGLLQASPGALHLGQLLITSREWMGGFERYLHSLANSSWQVTITCLLSSFPEYAAAQLGNELAVDASLAFGGLAPVSLYHYSSVRAPRLRWAAREVDRLLGF